MTLPRVLIAASLLLWLHAGRFCCAQDLVLNWNIAYSGQDPRGVGWGLEDGGWPKFIERHVKPALAWCEASGVKPAILIHHPWGQGDVQPMYLDGYDQARYLDAKWLTREFATAKGWKSVTKEVPCYGYVGGAQLTDRLRNLSTAERCAMTVRNLKPFADAGFRGVYLDWAENALSVPFQGVNARQSTGRSCDVLTLAIADDLFPEPTGIEATPRAFEPFRPLWSRNVVMQNSTWLHRYGPNRHANFKALGYDRSVLTGKVWRTLPYSDDVAATVEQAKAIAADGCVPAVSPQPLIKAGLLASEVAEGDK